MMKFVATEMINIVSIMEPASEEEEAGRLVTDQLRPRKICHNIDIRVDVANLQTFQCNT